MFKIRYRLLLVNVLAVAAPIVGIGFARFYEGEMLRAVEDDMVHQAQLMREVIVADPAGLNLAGRQRMLERAARHTVTRIRLVDVDGRVAADSHRTRDAPEVTGRREVRRAMKGHYGSATRAGQDHAFLFSAVPIKVVDRVVGIIYVSRSTTAVHAAMHRLRSSLYRVLFWSVLATVILSFILAATVSRPLVRLTRLAKRIAGGDRTARLKLDRRDEIGELARAFDAMAQNLRERAQDTRVLAANISHEFKSPLTSMRGAAELLLDGAADDPGARERFLENIVKDVDRLDRLVSRLLEFSRAASDDPPEETIAYPQLLSAAAPGAAIEYRTDFETVVAPRTHLESVVSNLYENARTHAAGDTDITIVVESDGRELVTSVHNWGQPISPGNMLKIWDRFFTTRASSGGTGLGLPIVKTIIVGCGGDVGATSDAATGTSFFFTLPLG